MESKLFFSYSYSKSCAYAPTLLLPSFDCGLIDEMMVVLAWRILLLWAFSFSPSSNFFMGYIFKSREHTKPKHLSHSLHNYAKMRGEPFFIGNDHLQVCYFLFILSGDDSDIRLKLLSNESGDWSIGEPNEARQWVIPISLLHALREEDRKPWGHPHLLPIPTGTVPPMQFEKFYQDISTLKPVSYSYPYPRILERNFVVVDEKVTYGKPLTA